MFYYSCWTKTSSESLQLKEQPPVQQHHSPCRSFYLVASSSRFINAPGVCLLGAHAKRLHTVDRPYSRLLPKASSVHHSLLTLSAWMIILHLWKWKEKGEGTSGRQSLRNHSWLAAWRSCLLVIIVKRKQSWWTQQRKKKQTFKWHAGQLNRTVACSVSMKTKNIN